MDRQGLWQIQSHLNITSDQSKLIFFLYNFSTYIIILSLNSYFQLCCSSCPCRLEESCKTDDIFLNSLEEVEIICYRSSQEKYLLEIVEQLLRCNAPISKTWSSVSALLLQKPRWYVRRSGSCVIQILKSNSRTFWMGCG